jgi:hypothetical protein
MLSVIEPSSIRVLAVGAKQLTRTLYGNGVGGRDSGESLAAEQLDFVDQQDFPSGPFQSQKQPLDSAVRS